MASGHLSDQAAQPLDALTEQGSGALDIARGPRDLASYPERLFARDMAAIYRISLKRFYKLAEAGAFTFAEIRPRIGRQSWSRERVRLHFAGELTGLTGRRKVS